MDTNFAGAILDVIPVDHSAQSGVVDDDGQTFVVVERVLDDVPRNELIIKLTQRHGETLRRVFVEDDVGLLDPDQGLALKADVFVPLLHEVSFLGMVSLVTPLTSGLTSAGYRQGGSRADVPRAGRAAVLPLCGGVGAACQR